MALAKNIAGPTTAQQTAEKPNLGIQELNVTSEGTVKFIKLLKYGSGLKAGVMEGDELVGINGSRLPKERTLEYVAAILAQAGFGATVKIHVMRAGKQLDLNVTLLKRKVLALDLEEVSEVLERKIAP